MSRFLFVAVLAFASMLPSLTIGQSPRVPSTTNPPPTKPFQLVLFYDSVDRAAANQAWQMVSRPKSAEMQRWMSWCETKKQLADSQIARQNHDDVLREAERMPAIALIDARSGRRWALFSGSTMPADDYELARQLDIIYGATMSAAAEVGVNAIQTVDRDRYHELGARAGTIGSGYSDGYEAVGGPFRRKPDRDGSFFNPSLDANLTAQTGIDAKTRWSLIGVAAFALLGVLALCVTGIGCTWMYCETVSDEE